MDVSTNVIPFPRRLRVVPPVLAPAALGDLVDHDGRTYRLIDLLGHLTSGEQRAVEATAPRTAQAAWDTAVRWWPALADEIAAGARVVE